MLGQGDTRRGLPALSLRPRRGSPALLAWALLGCLVLGGQLLSGAFWADFGYDEASHYVSGLLLRDYLLSGPDAAPLDYLRAFHSHYPLVGIGHWGPLYYVLEAAWMLVVSPCHASVLLLSAAITTLTSGLIFREVARHDGAALGLLAGALYALAPPVWAGTNEIMLDGSVALLCLLAMLAYARYLESLRLGHSLAYGALATAALLVKGNGACLALLPPLAVLLGRRDLPARWSFWAPVPLVALVAGPWYALTYGQVSPGFRYVWGWRYASTATHANASLLLGAVGPLALILAGAACLSLWRVPAARRPPARVAAVALLLSVWIFQSAVPAAIQDRYLAPLLPPLLILAAGAAARLAAHLPLRRPAAATASVAGLLMLSFVAWRAPVAARPSSGFDEAAATVWAERVPANPSVLIVADGATEAALVAAIAAEDHGQPGLYALRGSRLLGAGGYNDGDYAPRFRTPEEVAAAIDGYAIPLVLLRGGGAWAHVGQVEAARQLDPARWQPLWESNGLTLYRLRGNERRAADPARLRDLAAPRALGGG